MSNLNKLVVDENSLTFLAAKYLKESNFLGKLRRLSFDRN
jgi:hypothetical protein